MAEQQERIYELVYLASPDLDDAGIEALRAEIDTEIVKQGGSIRDYLFMAKRRLAYPVQRAEVAYAVAERLIAKPETMQKLSEALTRHSKIMRHVFVRVTEKLLERLRPPKITPAMLARRAAKMAPRPVAATQPKTEEEKKVDIAEIEKKLDEILGREF